MKPLISNDKYTFILCYQYIHYKGIYPEHFVLVQPNLVDVWILLRHFKCAAIWPLDVAVVPS